MPCLLLALLLGSFASAESLEGYEVAVHERVSAEAAAKAKARLAAHLKEVSRVAPRLHQATRGKVKFWITDSRHQSGAATYHPSARWLLDHHFDPAMAKGIEIVHVEHYLEWTLPHDQPMMTLHELAHAYHHQELGYEHEGVLAAFERAAKSGRYESVGYRGSAEKRRAYALTNEKEYFAELCEAYFGRNDFFPYERRELKAHDPEAYHLVHELLGGE